MSFCRLSSCLALACKAEGMAASSGSSGTLPLTGLSEKPCLEGEGCHEGSHTGLIKTLTVSLGKDPMPQGEFVHLVLWAVAESTVPLGQTQIWGAADLGWAISHVWALAGMTGLCARWSLILQEAGLGLFSQQRLGSKTESRRTRGL